MLPPRLLSISVCLLAAASAAGALFLFTGLYIAGVLGLGMLISTVAQTRMQNGRQTRTLKVRDAYSCGNVEIPG